VRDIERDLKNWKFDQKQLPQQLGGSEERQKLSCRSRLSCRSSWAAVRKGRS